MKTQLILYDQLNTQYCYNDVSQHFFLLSKQSPLSPYGPLKLNPHSQEIEYKASQRLISSLQES